MPYRNIPLVTQEYYHIYNRGLAEQNVFFANRDRSHFIDTMFYYQVQNPKPKFSKYRVSKIFQIDTTKKLVEIICYCLMPNHFHLLVKQIQDGGISEFIRKFIHSYIKYINVKYNRKGPLFSGMFKAVRVESEEQLLHLSRYIHLNPAVSLIAKDLELYPWSSYQIYLGLKENPAVAKEIVLSFFNSPLKYKRFVLDQTDYGIALERIKHAVFDLER